MYAAIGIGYFFGYLFKTLYYDEEIFKNKLDIVLLFFTCILVWPISVILLIISSILDSILDDMNEKDK